MSGSLLTVESNHFCVLNENIHDLTQIVHEHLQEFLKLADLIERAIRGRASFLQP